MAIKLTPSVSNPAVIEYLHTKDQVTSIKGLLLSESLCCFCKCDVCLPAVADLSDNNIYKNDFYSFILSTPTNSTVTGTLIKIAPDGTETSFVIIDDTYGTFYSLGTLRADVWAFKLDWRKVAITEGFGRYRFNITVENPFVREIFNEDTPCFELQPWSCETEHSTVRMETSQRGYIEDGFDFRGLSIPPSTTEIAWPQQIRLYGELSRTIATDTDSVEDNQRQSRQIQTRNFRNWNLRLDWIPGKVSSFLIDEMLLSNPIKISDFNQFSVERYRDIETKYLDVEDPQKPDRDVYEFFNIKFEDYKKGKIKRHG